MYRAWPLLVAEVILVPIALILPSRKLKRIIHSYIVDALQVLRLIDVGKMSYAELESMGAEDVGSDGRIIWNESRHSVNQSIGGLLYNVTEYQYQQLRNYYPNCSVVSEIGRQPLKDESPNTAVQQLNYAIALLREWVDDPGGKVCDNLYQRSREWLEQQHN